MICNSAFTGVAVAGMSRTLRASATPAHVAAAAYPAHAAAGAAVAVNPTHKRRTAAATVTSVDRGFL